MSTGRRLAKRSIIGTRVSAPGPDGIWYSGVIEDCSSLTSDTRYMVRFDFKTSDFDEVPVSNNIPFSDIMTSPSQAIKRNAMRKEFSESELIGPGFCTLEGKQLLCGQRVFITHNGRETSGDVKSHDREKDEVIVVIKFANEVCVFLYVFLLFEIFCVNFFSSVYIDLVSCDSGSGSKGSRIIVSLKGMSVVFVLQF